MTLRRLQTMDEFQQFKRNAHSFVHHSPFQAVIDTLFSCVMDVRDPQSYLWGGSLTLQVRINTHWYTLSYNRRLAMLTFRRGGPAGDILRTFTSAATPDEVRRFFETLRPSEPCRFHPYAMRA